MQPEAHSPPHHIPGWFGVSTAFCWSLRPQSPCIDMGFLFFNSVAVLSKNGNLSKRRRLNHDPLFSATLSCGNIGNRISRILSITGRECRHQCIGSMSLDWPCIGFSDPPLWTGLWRPSESSCFVHAESPTL